MLKQFCLLMISCLLATSLHAETIFQLDFSSAKGDPVKWFKKQGWEFKEDMDEMNLRFENGALVIEPDGSDLGVIMTRFEEKDFLKGVNRLKIEWGVDQYPDGADWSGPKSKTRKTREAVSLMVFFGKKKVDSGSMFVPNLPRFMTFFLGEKERPDKEYYGNYWQKGGRYFCIPCNGKTGTFITDVKLSEKFQKTFGLKAPPISGLAIETDVKKTKKRDGRHAKAFIRKIEFLKD